MYKVWKSSRFCKLQYLISKTSIIIFVYSTMWIKWYSNYEIFMHCGVCKGFHFLSSGQSSAKWGHIFQVFIVTRKWRWLMDTVIISNLMEMLFAIFLDWFSKKKFKLKKCKLYNGKFMLSSESIFQSSRTMDKQLKI